MYGKVKQKTNTNNFGLCCSKASDQRTQKHEIMKVTRTNIEMKLYLCNFWISLLNQIDVVQSFLSTRTLPSEGEFYLMNSSWNAQTA